ncbi:hypothetical protein FRC09_014957, partial [Ceratobasidium sp. 395]
MATPGLIGICGPFREEAEAARSVGKPCSRQVRQLELVDKPAGYEDLGLLRSM